MLNILYSKKFVKELRSLITANPKLASQIDKSLELFVESPRHHSLRVHKLNGKLNTAWSISVNRSQRIVFQRSGNAVTLLCFGTHDEVYR